MFTGREIINGTFTHPSPVAGLVYTGSADDRPITRIGVLEVEAPAGRSVQVDFIYREGMWERAGVVLTALALILCGGTAWMARERR